ncbi:uncharacterized protein LOC119577147 [Penaeus monodon]|uniref:uncharacterized protein LOC119577147 n=1 Tax=Penaeus monodon TaxID=6687 RepID=UPI0018A74BA3|nr:uncharacterized protein LOC119577147 [Penaeus monodon]
MRSALVVACVLAALALPLQALPPPAGGEGHSALQPRPPRFASGRHLTWWIFGDDDEEVTTPDASDHVSPTPPLTSSPGPTTTEAPSTWRSWFSNVGDKIKSAASKVKDELREVKEAYDTGRAAVGTALKEGANKVGSAIKSGFRKIKIKFTGGGEKFNIMATRLKEKLEAGDERILELMKKLGINVNIEDNKVTGTNVDKKNVSVTEILHGEGLLSNKSAHYHTVVEEPEFTGGERAPELGEGAGGEATTEEVFHSAEDHDTSHVTEDYDTFHSAEDHDTFPCH